MFFLQSVGRETPWIGPDSAMLHVFGLWDKTYIKIGRTWKGHIERPPGLAVGETEASRGRTWKGHIERPSGLTGT